MTVCFFCFPDAEEESRQQAESFLKYQRFMQCPQYWSTVASTNVRKSFHFARILLNFNCLFLFSSIQALPFAHDLCMQFEMYCDPNHTNRCRKRHCIVEEDKPSSHLEHFSIAFRILHFYSAVHYKAEIFAEKDNDSCRWEYLNSQYRTEEIHLSDVSPCKNGQNLMGPIVFQRIFDRMYDPHERFERYEAKVMLKFKKILLIEEMEPWRKQSDSNKQIYSAGRMPFMSDLYYQFGKSYEIRNRLARMLNIHMID